MSTDNTSKKSRLNSATIAKILRERIDNQELQQHERLPPERDLATMFSVSRNTIRNSLQHLHATGHITIKKNSGAYVNPATHSYDANSIFQEANPIDLIDARTAMEPHICRLAVLNARKQDIEDLENLLDIMDKATNDSTTFAVTDSLFHARLAKATGNILICWFIEEINIIRKQEQWTKMRKETLSPAIIEKYNAQHRTIIEAIKSRNTEQAANAMRDHLSSARASLISKLID